MSASAQLALPLGHRTAFGREDFLVTAGNAAAVSWLDRWPDWPGPALALHGPGGCGKSHLAEVWRARSGARLLRPSRLAEAEPPALLDGARACVIDPGGPADGPWPPGPTERALLHLYNCLAELGGHLLLIAEHPPASWRLGLPDLASRLRAAPAVAVGTPDDDLIAAVLVKQFADRQLAVGVEVIGYLQTHMERSFDAARRVVAALDETALAAQRRVTVRLAREVLASLDGNEGRT